MNDKSFLVHGLYFMSVAVFVGTLFFDSVIFRQNLRQNGRSNTLIKSLWGIAFVLCLIWSYLSIAQMIESRRLEDFWLVVPQTHYGVVSCISASILAILGVAVWRSAWKLALVLSVALVLTFPFLGHAGAVPEGRLLNILIDATHLSAVSIWSGGLLNLLVLLARPKVTTQLTPELTENAKFLLVRRFSRFAIGATLGILLAGSILAYRYGMSFSNLIRDAYGRTLVLKLAFFLAALAAAALNHFLHLRRWAVEMDQGRFSKAIQREAGVELFFVICAFLAAGYLTALSPPQ